LGTIPDNWGQLVPMPLQGMITYKELTSPTVLAFALEDPHLDFLPYILMRLLVTIYIFVFAYHNLSDLLNLKGPPSYDHLTAVSG